MWGLIAGWLGTIIISLLGAYITAKHTIAVSKEQFLSNNHKEDMEKAIQMSKFYVEEILPFISYMTVIYSNNKPLQKYSEKINFQRKKGTLKFNMTEIRTIFTESEIAEIRKIIDPGKIDVNALKIARARLLKSRFNDEVVYSKIEDNLKQILRLQLIDEYANVKTTLLNNLEYFSMYFCTCLADEEIVYQSLHQTFLAIVTYLYFDIAFINKEAKDKFFVNVIELYNLWNKRDLEKMQIEENMKDDSIVQKPRKYTEKK